MTAAAGGDGEPGFPLRGLACFLTENAVYLILWNARQGHESGKRDLWYWLELLKMRVREPKFLLVATHIEHTQPDLNLADIERAYSGCHGHPPVELENLKGFAPLHERILELAAQSQSLRAEWPADWLPVRDEIRRIRQEQPHLAPAKFQRVMKRLGVSNPVAQHDQHDSGWHETPHSLYRFTPDREWFDELKKGWNGFAGATRYVAALAKATGKAARLIQVEAAGLVAEKLPEALRSPAGTLARAMGERGEMSIVELETRHLLQQLIEHLDSQRTVTERKNGGLHKQLIDDGRVLWLCPEHWKLYKGRG